MELRVWVDGAQRVVCGVKLTTTCQEIVFALAHATQQAGRFTMIERWRNNERLLSPNEQPLVTLQRWGDHMNEVEFILRKTSNGLPNHHNHLKSPLSQQQQLTLSQPHPHPQQQPQQQQPSQPLQSLQSRIPNHPLRASLSTSTLYSPVNNMNASPSNSQANTLIQQPLYYNDERNINPTLASSASSSYILRYPHNNGYSLHSETQLQQQTNLTNQSQTEQAQISKNYPYDDLYSTINKKRTNGLPPVVPAKPRVIGPIAQYNNFYHLNQSPLNMYSSNFRPRQPPGYLDYMKAFASSSLTHNYNNTTDKSPDSDYNTTDQSPDSVSQMGHDMLKVIEEQKKVLMNQRNELNMLDINHEAKQNSDSQSELITRIENEIKQLEELWKENQAQIQKLEDQNFEKELQDLKAEQVKMELELNQQKGKLSRIETDIILCKKKIAQLEESEDQ